jgi:hypothetical protein
MCFGGKQAGNPFSGTVTNTYIVVYVFTDIGRYIISLYHVYDLVCTSWSKTIFLISFFNVIQSKKLLLPGSY